MIRNLSVYVGRPVARHDGSRAHATRTRARASPEPDPHMAPRMAPDAVLWLVQVPRQACAPAPPAVAALRLIADARRPRSSTRRGSTALRSAPVARPCSGRRTVCCPAPPCTSRRRPCRWMALAWRCWCLQRTRTGTMPAAAAATMAVGAKRAGCVSVRVRSCRRPRWGGFRGFSAPPGPVHGGDPGMRPPLIPRPAACAHACAVPMADRVSCIVVRLAADDADAAEPSALPAIVPQLPNMRQRWVPFGTSKPRSARRPEHSHRRPRDDASAAGVAGAAPESPHEHAASPRKRHRRVDGTAS